MVSGNSVNSFPIKLKIKMTIHKKQARKICTFVTKENVDFYNVKSINLTN